VTSRRINRNGIVLYRGPSLIDGRPIVVIATGLRKHSDNGKTGHMVQTWILEPDATTAAPTRTICGTCPHRSGACYVEWHRAPRAVLRCYQRGGYRDATLADFRALKAGVYGPVRAGAAGDPAAAPDALWRILRPRSGYTHDWRNSPGLRGLLMASVDTPDEARRAHAEGWRTFRVVGLNETPATATGAREIECPSEKVACSDCGLCDGTRMGARAVDVVASIWIRAHGAGARKFLPVVRS